MLTHAVPVALPTRSALGLLGLFLDMCAVPSESCSAFSELLSEGKEYGCARAFDGDPDTDWAADLPGRGPRDNSGRGSWIQSNFDTSYRVTRFEHGHRLGNGMREANKRITLSFSDPASYPSQSFRLTSGMRIESFDLHTPVETSFVNITVTRVYGTINNGARHIAFFSEGMRPPHTTAVVGVLARATCPPTHPLLCRPKRLDAEI